VSAEIELLTSERSQIASEIILASNIRAPNEVLNSFIEKALEKYSFFICDSCEDVSEFVII
jgi:recombinational DNA repair protein RecR